MKKVEKLKKEALGACKLRGHKMERFQYIINGGWIRGGSKCKKCGKYVTINTNPLPNQIEIGGDAVALNCN